MNKMPLKLSQLLSRYSIKRKLNFSFLSLFIFLVMFLALFIGRFSYNNISQEVDDKLQALAYSRANNIETYFEQNIERFKLITSRTAMRRILDEYNSSPNQAALDSVTNILKDAVAPLEELERICIFSLGGEVIASTDENFLGRDVSQKEFFIRGQERENVYFVEEDGRYKLFVSGPIQLEDRLIGVGLSAVNLDYLENIIYERAGLGETGEILIAFYNEERQRVYPVKRLFEDQALESFKESDLTAEPMKMALSGVEKVFNNTLDYRDERVLAASVFVPTGNIGLVAKIDRKEALGSLSALLIFYIAIVVVFVLFYLIISNYIINTIIRPLELLRKGVGIVQEGNLDYKLKMEGQDEVALLSKAFDQMSEGIKMARSQVDKKVEEQTAEIDKKAKNLEDQRSAILNILEDIDEEKQNTEREKEKIDAILHSIGDAVFVVNNKMEILMFNKIAEEISGYKSEEVLGKKYNNILRFIFEKDQKVNDEFIKSAIESGEIKEMANHTMLIRKDGEKVAVADSASPLKDKNGEIKGCVVVFRDVTEEREIDKAKTEFVSLASHQLRTPLSSINWYTEMLLNGDAGKISKEQKDFLKEIYKGNQRMVDLVNALLNVSRIEMGTLAIEPELINLNSIAEDSLKEMEHQIEINKLKINRELDKNISEIKADKKLVRIVFQNLISNAIKYTPEKGSITVKTLDKDSDILIEVSDTGYGIPKKQQKNIFSKLFRADNVQEKDTEGTGLGLYIIKAIIDQAGGKIWFESEENKGTTFFIELPKKGMKKKEGSKGLSEVK